MPVDFGNGIVKFPENVQQECIDSAPKIIPAVNRQGEQLLSIGDGPYN
jgi:hypothetical protein